MNSNIERFLEFNGKRISVLLADGSWWVAVKPICDALNVNYNRAFQNLKEDKILGQLFAKQQTTGADFKTYFMVCLPEKYIYGWLFSIRSNSPELIEYKKVCYDVLYNHFHGTLTGRLTALSEKSATAEEIKELEQRLVESDEYNRIVELKKRQRDLNKRLKNLDLDLMQGQISLDI